jgi:integrase
MQHLSRPSVQATPHQRHGLPAALLHALERYFAHCQRNWPSDRLLETGKAWWANLTLPLRQMRDMGLPIESASDITPVRWYAYVDARLAAGISPVTLNGLLSALRGWLWFVAEAATDDGADAGACDAGACDAGACDAGACDAGASVDARMLSLRKLRQPTRVPKDVPPDDLLKLQRVIELAVLDANPHTRWRGIMDLAWFLLMLHSGLRTGEVRRLKPGDIDWQRRQIRIEGSKLLRSRIAPMSLQAVEALNNWITLRGNDPDLPDTVFLDRHKPLSQTYCYSRLNTYAARAGIGKIHPHQLRHSCATLLLNAGMPLHQVQAVLGHANIETTRGYARSYDGTVAADYTRAMLSVEQDLGLLGEGVSATVSPAQTVALLDALKSLGTLNSQQLDVLAQARAGVLGLAKQA